MEDVLVFLAVFTIYYVGSIGIIIVLFKIFFPAVPNEDPEKSRSSLEDRQTVLRHTTAHFNQNSSF